VTTLVLVPTDAERAHLGALARVARVETCGFGPVAAAARTAALLARHAPTRVLLVGIAGSYDLARAPLESAHAFTRVELDGLGVATERGFEGPRELGFPQLPADGGRAPVFDALPLAAPAGCGAALLVTAPTASADLAEREERRARRPAALAEDMEAFGVALAAREFGLPCAVVRGVSNAVGVRDRGHWRIASALAAARARALALLEETWSVSQEDGA
jgi:futalosine hydrolase